MIFKIPIKAEAPKPTINDIVDVNLPLQDDHRHFTEWSIHEYDGMEKPVKIKYANGEVAYSTRHF